MKSVVLLYCTEKEKVAGDVKDFLEGLDIKVIRIPKESNLGLTLDAKESFYLKSGDAFVFILTPDFQKDERWYPSPSVIKEMGIAQEKYKDKPEKIIYLVDKNCTPPAIDQKAYIPFDSTNATSIWSCVTLLIKDLKAAGVFDLGNLEDKKTQVINIPELVKSLDPEHTTICIKLADSKNFAMEDLKFEQLLITTYNSDQFKINLAQLKLLENKLIFHNKPQYSSGYWQLTRLGVDLAIYEIDQRPKLFGKSSLDTIYSNLAQSLGLDPPSKLSQK